MKRYIQVALFIFSFSLIQTQNVSPWKRIISTKNSLATQFDLDAEPKNGLFYELDKSVLKSSLDTIHALINPYKVVVEIPNTKGN